MKPPERLVDFPECGQIVLASPKSQKKVAPTKSLPASPVVPDASNATASGAGPDTFVAATTRLILGDVGKEGVGVGVL